MAYGKVFKDRTRLANMIARYRQGETISHLARAYGCDKSSIRKQLIKVGLYAKDGRLFKSPVMRRILGKVERAFTPPPLPKVRKPHVHIPSKYQHLFDADVPARTKSYLELYDAAKKRDLSLRYATPPPRQGRNQIADNPIHT